MKNGQTKRIWTKEQKLEIVHKHLDEHISITMVKPLLSDLKRIHRYYECTVNCTPMTVSQEMCLLARKVLAFLEQFGDIAITKTHQTVRE